MTDLICTLIRAFFGLAGSLVPDIMVDPRIIENAQGVVAVLHDFLINVNFLVPLPDIFLKYFFKFVALKHLTTD